MATTVARRPVAATLRRLGIAKPVYSAHGLRWADKVGGWINSPAAHRKPAAQ
jgi:hypothetical protein